MIILISLLNFTRELDLSSKMHDKADSVLKLCLLSRNFINYRSKLIAVACVQCAMDSEGKI
jgi:hypothetical protein